MKKIYLILFLGLIVLIAGCQKKEYSIDDIQSCQNSVKFWAQDSIAKNPNLNQARLEEEYLAKYCGDAEIDETTRIISINGYKVRIQYLWNGHQFEGLYKPEFRDAVEWIKENVPENVIITSWWDYGHMIRGLTKRDVVIYGISKEVLETEQKTKPEYDPTNGDDLDTSNHIDFVNLAEILTNTNEHESIELMQNYNSKYLFITTQDAFKAPHFFFWSDENRVADTVIDYWETGIEKANEGTALFSKALSKQLENFELIYFDEFVVIYKVIG